MSLLRQAGLLLVVIGLLLAVMPTMAHDPGPAADTFQAIERRIPWGGCWASGHSCTLVSSSSP